MTTVFTIGESPIEILNALRNEDRFICREVDHDLDIPGTLKYHIADKEWPDAAAEVYRFTSEMGETEQVKIMTAWSGFEYNFRRHKNGSRVTYEGAYRGLLSQEILPSMTIESDLMSAPVRSSLGSDLEMRDYARKQEERFLALSTIGQQDNSYPHPRVIADILYPEWARKRADRIIQFELLVEEEPTLHTSASPIGDGQASEELIARVEGRKQYIHEEVISNGTRYGEEPGVFTECSIIIRTYDAIKRGLVFNHAWENRPDAPWRKKASTPPRR